jgi:hypothetical protein
MPMTIPVEWLLSVLIGLGGIIATLAGIIYKTLSSRIAAQDTIINRLQEDIDRLSKGCGLTSCIWKNR